MSADVLWSLDRLEGAYAVLVNGEKQCRVVPLAALTGTAREGNMYREVGDSYVVDADATNARQERVRALQRRLRHR